MAWPSSAAERDRYVLAHRPGRAPLDPWRAQGMLLEEEPAADGTAASTLTIFLTGRECPWRCAMCDLWQYTTEADTPPGAIPAQIEQSCATLEARGGKARQVKLYNAGSFFDPRAVPEGDYAAIARQLQRFERVIVECHPSLVGPRIDRFLEALSEGGAAGPALEVAMGLETAHPEALEQLNKRMDVPAFTRAAGGLRQRNVALRVFLLIAPPFVPPAEQDEWLLRSVDAALECGATVISLIPARGGNGTMERLATDGLFAAPDAATIARSVAMARAHAGSRARLLLDPWSGA